MPTAAPTVCSAFGCSAKVSHGRCPKHRSQRNQQIDAQRGTAKERGYDANHRRLRIAAFIRDGWKCADCGWEPDIVRQCRELGLSMPPTDRILQELAARRVANQQHLHGDHQIPIASAPELRLDLGNYATRCSTCHGRKTMREMKG